MAIQLNRYTPSLEHYDSINSGIIDLTEGNTPQVGTPVPTIRDASLGLLTVLVVILWCEVSNEPASGHSVEQHG